MAERVDVFISSTSRDLDQYRSVLRDTIIRLGMYPIGMESFNPTNRNALQVCYDKVQEAEIFIGIYAHRYGYVPASDMQCERVDKSIIYGDDETSITHFEYLWALEKNLPMLLYVLSDVDGNGNPLMWPLSMIEDDPGRTRLKNFKNTILLNHTVRFFHSPDNLASLVATGIHECLKEVENQRRESLNQTMIPTNEINLVVSTKGKIVPRETVSRDFYKHMQLPENYVPREELLEKLRIALLGDANIALTSAVKGATAFHGMGGIGKSIMALALCDDPVVQAAFPDGILWTTLGQEPNLNDKLREWIGALGGTINENAPTIDRLKAILAELLESRTCLLIVDDVWQKRDAEVFRVGSQKCHLLITTRDAEVARAVNAVIRPIPAMERGEAILLLKEWAGNSLEDTDSDTLDKIIDRLGCLPLAIKLAGAQLHTKDPQKWLKRFDVYRLEDKRPHPDDPHNSLERCFGMSIGELNSTVRKLYAALAIFKEDEAVREVAVMRLWQALDNMDEEDSEELIDDLAARALLQVIGSTSTRTIILHDLLRDFMMAEVKNLQEVHGALLDVYAQTQDGSGWHTTLDDGYIYDHLVFHFIKAGRKDELEAILRDARFIAKRLSRYQSSGIINDLNAVIEKDIAVETMSRIRRVIRNNAIHLDRCTTETDAFNNLLIRSSLAERRLLYGCSELLLDYRQPLPDTYSDTLINRFVIQNEKTVVWRFSPDGRNVVSATESGQVKIWSVETGEIFKSVSQRGKPLNNVWNCYYAENNNLYITDHNGYLHTYDVIQETWKKMKWMDDTFNLSFSSDAKLVLAITEKHVDVWDILKQERVHRVVYEGLESMWNSRILGSDGSTSITLGDSKENNEAHIILWDTMTGSIIKVINDVHMGKSSSNAIVSGKESDWFVTWDNNGVIVVWDKNIFTPRFTFEIPGFRSANEGMVIDDQYFVLTDKENTLYWFCDALTGEIVGSWSGSDEPILHSSNSLTKDRFISATVGGKAFLWDFSQVIRQLQQTEALSVCNFRGDGSQLITGTQAYEVKVWDVEQMQLLRSEKPHEAAITEAIFFDHDTILTASTSQTKPDRGHVLLYDLEKAQSVKRWRIPGVQAAAVSRYRRFIVLCNSDLISSSANYIELIDGLNYEPLWRASLGENNSTDSQPFVQSPRRLTQSRKLIDSTNSAHSRPIYSCVFRPITTNSDIIDSVIPDVLSASSDRKIRLWLGESGELLKEFDAPYGITYRVEFLPDDADRFLSCHQDGTLRLWDLRADKELLIINAHNSSIMTCAIHPKGTHVATGGEDNCIKIWDIAQQASLMTLYTDGFIKDCAWSPSGKQLVCVGERGLYWFNVQM